MKNNTNRHHTLVLVITTIAMMSLTSTLSTAQTLSVTVDSRAGNIFNRNVRGVTGGRGIFQSALDASLSASFHTSLRALPSSGLDADTYNWYRVDSGIYYHHPECVGTVQPTLLECMEQVRTHNAAPLMTINMVGDGHIVTTDTATCGVVGCPDRYNMNRRGWHCMPLSTDAATNRILLARRAADMVLYTNVLLQKYRVNGSGQVVNKTTGAVVTLNDGDPNKDTDDEARVYNTIAWSPKLPSYQQPVVEYPKIFNWEIGNEPEVDDIPGYLWNHAGNSAGMDPTEYQLRYHAIATKMREVDASISVGPCVMEPHKTISSRYLDALKNAGEVINFVSYHPYYFGLRNTWYYDDQAPSITGLQNALRYLKVGSSDPYNGMDPMANAAKTYSSRIFCSEWNPSHWDHEGYRVGRSMAHALAVVESIFTFIQEGVQVANYFAHPQDGKVLEIFKKLQDHVNYKLVNAYSDGAYVRLYTVQKAANKDLVVWGMNFHDSSSATVNLTLDYLNSGAPSRGNTYTVTRWVFRNTAGDTSLAHYDSEHSLGWVAEGVRYVTASNNNGRTYLTLANEPFRDAELTLLIVHPIPLPPNQSTDKRPAIVKNDFDGDRTSDIVLYQPAAQSTWHILRSQLCFNAYEAISWGSSSSSDIPLDGDFDGDGLADAAVFRGADNRWTVRLSSTGALWADNLYFGQSSDKFVPGDYDGDGRTDLGVYRPSNGTWYINYAAGGSTSGVYGTATDIPVPADYDGDGITDWAVYRPYDSGLGYEGVWYVRYSSGQQHTPVPYGEDTDIPVPADYDLDGKADYAVYRPSTGYWYVSFSSGGQESGAYGLSTDKPVPADYDGDGKADWTVYRDGGTSWWCIRQSGPTPLKTNPIPFGSTGMEVVGYR